MLGVVGVSCLLGGIGITILPWDVEFLWDIVNKNKKLAGSIFSWRCPFFNPQCSRNNAESQSRMSIQYGAPQEVASHCSSCHCWQEVAEQIITVGSKWMGIFIPKMSGNWMNQNGNHEMNGILKWKLLIRTPLTNSLDTTILIAIAAALGMGKEALFA